MTKGVPLALSHNVKCNHILHENVLLVAVSTAETPRVSEEDRVVVAPIAEGVTRVGLRFGFMEQPNVPEGLAIAVARGQIAKFDPAKVIYFTGHETIIPTGRRKGMVAMARSAVRVHASQRPAARRLFQDPERANHGNRHRIRDLSWAGQGRGSAPPVQVALRLKRRSEIIESIDAVMAGACPGHPRS